MEKVSRWVGAVVAIIIYLASVHTIIDDLGDLETVYKASSHISAQVTRLRRASHSHLQISIFNGLLAGYNNYIIIILIKLHIAM